MDIQKKQQLVPLRGDKPEASDDDSAEYANLP
jgi:hypothetical protein